MCLPSETPDAKRRLAGHRSRYAGFVHKFGISRAAVRKPVEIDHFVKDYYQGLDNRPPGQTPSTASHDRRDWRRR